MSRVACVGECMVELGLPRPGETAARLGFAGDTANAAIYLKRAAGAAVAASYVTAVGTDALSDGMVDFLGRHGLETDLIERRPDRAPGLYAISLDAAGERSFTYWREASAARTLFEAPCTVTPERMAGFDLIYLSGITLAVLSPTARQALRKFLAEYRRTGGRVAFDSNYRPRLWPDRGAAQREIGALWKLTDVGLPSVDDEFALWGDADEEAVLARLARAGVREGALKRGPAGPRPIGWDGDAPEFAPEPKPVDTTAAGDSFNGAYLAALLAGLAPPERLAAGHAMAAHVIRHPGAVVPPLAAGGR
jgi:2-dehydro-3-deoxygluconokinase